MPNAYYIPDGPKNLATLFSSIDFTQISSYYVEILAGSTVIGTTPVYKNTKLCEDEVHIHFRNFPGGNDAIIFKIIEVDYETKSESFESPDSIPLVQEDHGINRINIHGNESYTVSAITNIEANVPFFKEVFNSSLAWLETDISYIPIVITDKKVPIRKNEERFEYEIQLEFTLSHEDITQRI